MDGERPHWPALAWLVFAAFAVHNLEEALSFPGYAARMAGRVPVLPPAWAFQALVAVVTVAGLLLVVVGVRSGRPACRRCWPG
ncbi:hypothetical protein [Micromonospora zhanjiangensis]